MTTYWQRLADRTNQRGTLCVGIDPHPGLLKAWGLDVNAAGLETFARRVVEVLGERVAVFKPQSAFFEAHGSAGVAVLEDPAVAIGLIAEDVVEVVGQAALHRGDEHAGRG